MRYCSAVLVSVLLLKTAVASRSLQELANAVGWGAKTTRRTTTIVSMELYACHKLFCSIASGLTTLASSTSLWLLLACSQRCDL